MRTFGFLNLWRNWVSSLRALLAGKPSPETAPQRRFRPLLEALEGLVLPATLTWVGGTNVWSDANNWSTGTTPTVNDDVVFNNTSVLNSAVDPSWFDGAVRSLTIAAGYTGTITLKRDLAAATVTQADGNIGGTDGALTASWYTWSGGTQFGDPLGRSTTIVPNGVLTISGAGVKTLNGRSLLNGGLATWTQGNIRLENSALFENQSNSVFTASNGDGVTVDVSSDGNPLNFFTVDSGATFNQTTATVIRMEGNLANGGAINLTGGTAQQHAELRALGNLSMDGSVNLSANAEFGIFGTAECQGGQGGQGFTGRGTTSMYNGSELKITGGVFKVSNFQMLGGIIAGSGTFEVVPGASLRWEQGTMQGTGTTHISANAGMTINGAVGLNALVLVDHTLSNDGTLIWAQGNMSCSGGSITNNANATFRSGSAGTISDDSPVGGQATTIANAGAFSTIPLLGDPATTIRVPFTNSGTLTVGGSLNFTGDLTQTAGDTQLIGGNLQMTGRFNINGGTVTVTGSRTITAVEVVNGGTIQYAATHGILTVIGNYTQTKSGTLSISIGGLPNQPNLYDQLIVQAAGAGTGVAKLAGTIKARFDANFQPPNVATVWTFMTYASLDPMGQQFGNTDFGGIAFAVTSGNTSTSITYTP